MDYSKDAQPTELGSVGTGLRWLRIIRKELRQDPRFWCGLILLILIVAAIFAPVLSPYSPTDYQPAVASQGPSMAHLLGTDSLGRDQLSRVIYGTRISLSVGLATIIMGGICGTLLGLLAAYFRGWVDQLVSIITDALLSFPSLILALAIVAALGPSVINLALALALVRVPIYARIARGQALQVASLDYVSAARACGTGSWKIMLRHICPNIVSPLLVQATISISLAILDESILSFLGLGVPPPTPEWGAMVSEAQTFLPIDPWMMVGPALAVVIVVLSLNILGDAVRDRLDPRDMTRISAPSHNP
ncbi:ABC transporter permease [Ktedonosporobacter rubrisoli]|uniref:ABC transporter permease n=1 Tax=Ktedonosporobacter rubrisoli TaxID=2509675 RepID=A0A4P6JVA4_KTERU|nr:ABC transporter permease [Ktedonosporobacter rubrisoli]QBD78886.1 ABC transporter permease [Ktedonosporobacter rubrisoli]